jgi:hypothetical protein
MDYTIPYKDYDALVDKVNKLPDDSTVLGKMIGDLKKQIEFLHAEICLVHDKYDRAPLTLSEKNEKRLRTFIGEIKKIAPMNIYLLTEDSSSWYSDIDRDAELSLTLHSNCDPSGAIIFKAEIVSTLQHVRGIAIEMLGPATKSRLDAMFWSGSQTLQD